MQCLQVRAKVQQAILRCQFADSADWSGFEAHLVGSYSDGCGNSIVSADGSTDLESDIDVLLLDKTREPIHIASFCRCPTVSDSSKMAYEDGHVTISGVTSNPTKYYGPSHLKPSMDMVAAQICCCYPTIFLLDNARYFPENVLQALKIEIDRPQSCHVVSAAAPGRRGRQKRISTAFLENIVMKSLNTVQCWFFVTLKYIVKHAICTSTSTFGLKTYHVKTLLFQALDATPPECWQKENLRPLLLKSLTELESALKAVQPGDLKLMKHFFLPEAALYLKESSCAASIAESTTKVINSLDKVLNEFALMLRPQVGDEKIIYNPLLHFSLSFCRLNLVKPEDGTASESLPAHSAAIYNATVAVTRCMEILSTDESSKTDDEFAEAMALTETIGDFAIAAKENYIAKFCCRLDDEYKIDTDKLVLREFNSNIFPVHLSNHINAFYMNFNALAVYLAKILLPGQCNLPIIEDTTRLAEDPSADPQEIYLALIFGQDVDRLVGIAHRHRSVIGREPELQRAMRDRLFKDSTVGTRFLEVSIEKTCCQLLSKCKKSQH
uniref:Mab-21 domain-containing protein n=1 Tax=Macrostomum lignano TaxID=282301 RepID=A0A1I8HRK9_9PLAT